MLSHDPGYLGEFALGGLAGLAVLVIGYLLRLQWRELRKKRRMAEKGLYFGLVQDITALNRPLAASSTRGALSRLPGPAIVLGKDTRSWKWTFNVPPPALQYQWN